MNQKQDKTNPTLQQEFDRAIELFDAGKSQEGADALYSLAELGHQEAIEQLVYIFLDQKEFPEVERLLAMSSDPDSPVITYLRGRSLEEQGKFEEAREVVLQSASAGHHGSIIWIIDFSMRHEYLGDAQSWVNTAMGLTGWSEERLKMLHDVDDYLSNRAPNGGTSQPAFASALSIRKVPATVPYENQIGNVPPSEEKTRAPWSSDMTAKLAPIMETLGTGEWIHLLYERLQDEDSELEDLGLDQEKIDSHIEWWQEHPKVIEQAILRFSSSIRASANYTGVSVENLLQELNWEDFLRETFSCNWGDPDDFAYFFGYAVRQALRTNVDEDEDSESDKEMWALIRRVFDHWWDKQRLENLFIPLYENTQELHSTDRI